MPQHFLLSAAARTLSLSAVARMSDEEAHAKFVAIRWADTEGKPYCPECGCAKVYAYATRKLWKCSACRYKFSVTARTIFQDRKRPIRDYLLAIAIFANGAKGHSALQLSRDLDCQHKTAYVLAHKLREALGCRDQQPRPPRADRHCRNRRCLFRRQGKAGKPQGRSYQLRPGLAQSGRPIDQWDDPADCGRHGHQADRGEGGRQSSQ
jgi:ribosomal protein L37AE/L43A